MHIPIILSISTDFIISCLKLLLAIRSSDYRLRLCITYSLSDTSILQFYLYHVGLIYNPISKIPYNTNTTLVLVYAYGYTLWTLFFKAYYSKTLSCNDVIHENIMNLIITFTIIVIASYDIVQ